MRLMRRCPSLLWKDKFKNRNCSRGALESLIAGKSTIRWSVGGPGKRQEIQEGVLLPPAGLRREETLAGSPEEGGGAKAEAGPGTGFSRGTQQKQGLGALAPAPHILIYGYEREGGQQRPTQHVTWTACINRPRINQSDALRKGLLPPPLGHTCQNANHQIEDTCRS